jgi:hypothetical protein
MIPQSIARFAKPFTLTVRSSGNPRPRVVAPGQTLPGIKEEREFEKLPFYVHIDALNRCLLAYLPPIPEPLLLYRKEDFGAAVGDDMETHAERIITLCGDDPAAVLQPLIDGTAGNYLERPEPSARVPLEIQNWRAKAVLSQMGLIPAIEAAINGLPEPQRGVVLTAWNGDAKLARRGETVLAFSQSLGLTAKQVDDLFVAAERIVI